MSGAGSSASPREDAAAGTRSEPSDEPNHRRRVPVDRPPVSHPGGDRRREGGVGEPPRRDRRREGGVAVRVSRPYGRAALVRADPSPNGEGTRLLRARPRREFAARGWSRRSGARGNANPRRRGAAPRARRFRRGSEAIGIGGAVSRRVTGQAPRTPPPSARSEDTTPTPSRDAETQDVCARGRDPRAPGHAGPGTAVGRHRHLGRPSGPPA